MREHFGMMLVLFCLSSCYDIKYDWTDKKGKELYQTLPNDINECMIELDTILSYKAKYHFKEMEEKIAVIEISNDLGRIFIGAWNLIPEAIPYQRPKSREDRRAENQRITNFSNLSYFFNQSGISDPAEMIRIIFTCYHRRLNKGSFDFEETTNYYKAFWINSTTIGNGLTHSTYWELNKGINLYEDSILNNYYFEKALLKDTLKVSLYYGIKIGRKPNFYTIEGIISFKDTTKKTFQVKITQIVSSKGTSIWYDSKRVRRIGDLLEIRANKWSNVRTPRYYYR